MADVTSGTVWAHPAGSGWIGTVEVASASGGDVIGVGQIVGSKVDGIVFASSDSGTCSFSSTSGSVTLAADGGTKVFFHAISNKE